MNLKIISPFFVVILLTASSVLGQKGNWYVGGQLGIGTTTVKTTTGTDNKNFSWNIGPEIGTFLKKDLQLGFALNISGEHSSGIYYSPSPYETSATSTNWSPVIYLRKFYPISDKFSLFTGIVGSFTVGESTASNNPNTEIDKETNTGWGLHLALGAAYAVSKTFTLVGQYGFLGYSYSQSKDGAYKETYSSFGFNVNTLGPAFNVGIYWTFKER